MCFISAASASFNEVMYREFTVTATTPVEVLMLSKYDVFHRFSRSSRETLRASARSHAETVVYVDRFHKTGKWNAFKKKTMCHFQSARDFLHLPLQNDHQAAARGANHAHGSLSSASVADVHLSGDPKFK